MAYRIRHQTTYRYEVPANLCHNEARLRPRDLPGQHCTDFRLTVRPQPDMRASRTDGFGNHVDYFAIQRPHDELVILAESVVEIHPPDLLDLDSGIAWDEVAAALALSKEESLVEARGFTLASPFIPRLPELASYASADFVRGRPVIDAVASFTARIFEEFKFKPGFTDVSTPVADVFAKRAGVCQDFAQLMISALRTLGLPARYVSGYLETLPPPGKPKLVGADASHAWVSVFVPGLGWADFDPTNNVRPGARHVTTAIGRDYGDVCPLRGVTTGASEHQLKVAVDVIPG